MKYRLTFKNSIGRVIELIGINFNDLMRQLAKTQFSGSPKDFVLYAEHAPLEMQEGHIIDHMEADTSRGGHGWSSNAISTLKTWGIYWEDFHDHIHEGYDNKDYHSHSPWTVIAGK